MKRGFTLIELLVVVLIIGILAAIAVPQYQKAVLKSRYSSLMPTAKAIRDGQEIYYMTNNQYADEIAKLDVKTANTEDMTLDVDKGPDYAYTFATRGDLKNNLIMYQKHSIQFPGEIHCEAREDDAQAKWLCETALHAVKNLGKVLSTDYDTFVIEGNGNGLTKAQVRFASVHKTVQQFDPILIELAEKRKQNRNLPLESLGVQLKGCTRMTVGQNNQIYRCGTDIIIDGTYQKEKPPYKWVQLQYCPGKASNYYSCVGSRAFTHQFNMDGEWCRSYNTFGKEMCQAYSEYYGKQDVLFE